MPSILFHAPIAMLPIYYDADLSDSERRSALYDGALFIYSPRPETVALCELARQLSEEAFAPHHPTMAQYEMSVDEYVKILAELKPGFIHHPECKRLIPEVLKSFGCDLQATYFDVPRLRTVTSDGYLTSGLGYAFKPHRDTWYSPPLCQLNWWLPIYDISPQNTMAFHPGYWSRSIANGSHEFSYQDWQQSGRKQAAAQVKKDTRRQAAAEEELDLTDSLLPVCPPGGMMVFSAAQLHSTVPNTSGTARFSIDFRTVHGEELPENRGPVNRDSRCRGTTIRDYLRGSDLSSVPEEWIAGYESGQWENHHSCQAAQANRHAPA